MELSYYSGFDVLNVHHKGPVLSRAKYRFRPSLFWRRGISQSHRRKLQKQMGKDKIGFSPTELDELFRPFLVRQGMCAICNRPLTTCTGKDCEFSPI